MRNLEAELPTQFNHPVLGQVKAEYTYVAEEGNGEVFATLAKMREYALADAASAPVLESLQAAREFADRYRVSVAEGAWAIVKGAMSFVRDERLSESFADPAREVPVIEVLIRPVDLAGTGVAQRLGDCDDYSMWLASILVAAGVRCSFVVMAGDGRDAGRYSHVYVAAYPEGGGRTALDASHGAYAGWEAPNVYGLREEYPVNWDGGNGIWQTVLLIGAAVVGWNSRKGIGDWFRKMKAKG
jgi:transglutaminase-like putative cysteine protease